VRRGRTVVSSGSSVVVVVAVRKSAQLNGDISSCFYETIINKITVGSGFVLIVANVTQNIKVPSEPDNG